MVLPNQLTRERHREERGVTAKRCSLLRGPALVCRTTSDVVSYRISSNGSVHGSDPADGDGSVISFSFSVGFPFFLRLDNVPSLAPTPFPFPLLRLLLVIRDIFSLHPCLFSSSVGEIIQIFFFFHLVPLWILHQALHGFFPVHLFTKAYLIVSREASH